RFAADPRRGHQQVLGMRAIARDPEAGAAAPDFLALATVAGDDGAGVVATRDAWRAGLEMPGDVLDVAGIDGRGGHLDQDFARAGLGHVALVQLERGRRAVAVKRPDL